MTLLFVVGGYLAFLEYGPILPTKRHRNCVFFLIKKKIMRVMINCYIFDLTTL